MGGVLAIVVFAACELQAALVGYWPLDDDANDAVSTNHGVFVGNEAYVNGRCGKAATFDKDGCIRFGSDVLPQRAYTKAVWFRRPSFSLTNHVLCGSVKFHGHALWTPTKDPEQNSNYGPVAGHNDDFWTLRTSGFEYVLFQNTWYHLAVTYDYERNGTLSLYVDGQLAASRQNVSRPIDRSLVAAGYGEQKTMVGDLDDIAIWDRALSSNELLQVYQAGAAGNPLPDAGIQEPVLPVTLTNMPGDLQLYARETGSNAVTVAVAGEAAISSGVDRVALRVYRNGTPYAFQTQAVHTVSNAAPFGFGVAIAAELANYDFEVWSGAGTNETLISRSRNIVAGDVFVIEGQSNAECYKHYDTSHANLDPFIRTYGYGSDQSQEAFSYREWGCASGDGRVIRGDPGSVGQLGIRLGRQLLRELRVPVAILNGANGGAAIGFFQRNDSDPADMTTNYGRLLWRARNSGLREYVRAIVWYQGESDMGDAVTHEAGFRSLYADWCEDYPALERVYLHQLRADELPPHYYNIRIRDTQRRLGDSLEKVSVMSTTGLDGHDGLHFSYKEGYREMADHLAPLIARDLNGAPDAPNIESPNVLEAFISAANRREITIVTRKRLDTLVCDDGAELDFWAETSRLTPIGGTAERNRIVLTFHAACDESDTLQYNGHKYDGPWVTNALGGGLLAFRNVPVNVTTNAPAAPTGLHALTNLDTSCRLMWDESANSSHYRIYRNGDFAATVHAPSYRDTTVQPLSNYAYAVEAVNVWGTSGVAEATVIMPELPPAPPAPTGLRLHPRGAHMLEVWWDPVTNATHYNVTRDGSSIATTDKPLFVDAPLEAATSYTYTITALNAGGSSPASAPLHAETRAAAVYAHVPQVTNYTLVCAADLPEQGSSAAHEPAYLVNHAPVITSYFDRVGYYLELSDGLSTQWVFAAMDAFTPYVEELLLPNTAVNDVAFSRPVSNLYVTGSADAGVTTGAFTNSGRVEIWTGGYRATNVDSAPNASDSDFDWGDERAPSLAYGSFQVHNCDLDGGGAGTEGETILAYSGWERSALCDTGIGRPDDPGTAPDWTAAANAWDYARRRLYVVVGPARPPPPPPPPPHK